MLCSYELSKRIGLIPEKTRRALKGLFLLNTTDLPMAGYWTNKRLSCCFSARHNPNLSPEQGKIPEDKVGHN